MSVQLNKKDSLAFIINDYKYVIIAFIAGIVATIFLFTIYVSNSSQKIEEQFYKDSKAELYSLKEKLEFIKKKINLLEEFYVISKKSSIDSDVLRLDYKYIYYFGVYNKKGKYFDLVIDRNSLGEAFIEKFEGFDSKNSHFFKKNGKQLLSINETKGELVNLFIIDIDNILTNKLVQFSDRNIYIVLDNKKAENSSNIHFANNLKLMPYYYREKLDLFGKSYKIYFLPNVESVSPIFNAFSFYVLFGGTFLTIVSSLFLYKVIANERSMREINRNIELNQNILKIFIEHSPVQLAMLDENSKFIIYSDQWWKNTNISKNSLTGKSLFDIYPELGSNNFKQNFEKSLNNRIPIYGVDMFFAKNRKKSWLKYVIVPWKDKGTGACGNIVFIENVTDLYSKQEQLKNTVSRLRLANENMDDMLHIASHDLKEPLRGINLNIEILFEDFGGVFQGEVQKRLERIKELSVRLNEIITSISTYSKLGKEEIRCSHIDVCTVVDNIKHTLSEFLHKNNATVECQGEMPKDLFFSQVSIQQILYNLIVNAVKYNSKKERIVKIKHRHYNKYHRFSVIDNGDGIAREFYQSIFRMFKRLDKERSGAGTGLAFVKKIVERHGGKISIDSKVGEGSTFTFTILRELKNESF